ncbi:uncharacterized protein MELLADRAFT_40700 [Melampsora larici-populina 98AG31]|uniref:Tyrosinase copper-binding domain-containing protein n=1 Tax=Melampsora larici-populina (strain 98AG31 / pathotype 3-4-7) TaxID=747676 RepID=F4S9C3_MELLP|nr:uncharacterized protein MELLADRAFT_40700 [Melampsora larici-populina 98AG31]EGF98756.1 hypothetical protein MELLADRAFT_40700 [Melampsora larici-populina 98AG31]
MSLSKEERIDYTNSILCLKSKPSITPNQIAPGAKSRYDDFIVTHINQTFTIHGTGNFLAWHRYFIHIFEKALRDECGYKGYQPYWNWARTSQDILNSPDFNGQEDSLGSNGIPKKREEIQFVFGNRHSIKLSNGQGGGCIKSGPFLNMTVNLGPIGPLFNVGPLVKNPLDYNPRCITRDLSDFIAKNYQSESLILKLILNSQSIGIFQNDLQVNNQQDLMSLHQAGHFVFGGDPSSDIFVSPGEPMFFLHHAMVDKVWWIWQNLNPNQRTYSISGTKTMFNNPPSPEASLDDFIDLGYNAGSVKLNELMSTVKGPFNYIYV